MGKRNRHSPIYIGFVLFVLVGAQAFNFDDDLEDLIAEESNMDEEVFGGPVLPSDVFNDGKPFYVERDPSTGAFDFNHKKTANQIDNDEKGLYLTKDSHVSDTKDVIITQSAPNFHDFLNLPVKYSSSNFVYPLISSSYANLKYQGSSKGSNHKNASSTPSTTTISPKFQFTRPQYTTTPRLDTIRAQTSSTAANVTPSSTRYTYPTTSGRPITTTTTTTTTEQQTTTTPVKQLFTRYPYKSTIKNKYLETTETRKKFFLPSTLSMPPSTTQKPIFSEHQTTPVRSSTYYSPSIRPWSSPSASQPTTTPEPTTQSRPSNPIRFVNDDRRPISIETSAPKMNYTIPALKYEGNRPAPFRPLPAHHVEMLNRQNETSNKIDLPKDPSVMSLSDIFNAFNQDDKQAIPEDNENSIVFETTINQFVEQTTPPAIILIPDEPQQQSHNDVPKIEQSIDLTDQYVKYEVQQPNGHRPQQPSDDQYVRYEIHQSNGHRPQAPSQDVGNQYVKYEVQQPQMNVVKFGTVPSMNSVVISPNQNSATFVLGSQQSVGGGSSDGHFVGSVSQEASSAALNGHPSSYQMGQVLDAQNENTNVQVGSSVNVQVKPQDFIKTTSVRFPSESDDKFENAPIISGTHKSEVLPPNGHSAPVGAGGPNQMVVFPSNDKIDNSLHEVTNKIVFDTPNNDVLNKNELPGLPDLPETLMPPSNPENGPKRPRPPMISQGPPFMYKEIQRRPFPGDRIRPPLKLPNILPQFRPNAKISHGHTPYNKEAGNFRVPPPPPPKNLPLPNSLSLRPATLTQPSTSTLPIRRSPVSTKFMTRINNVRPQGIAPPGNPVEPTNDNRRYYRLPPPMLKDRVYHITPTNMKPPPPPGLSAASRFADSYSPLKVDKNTTKPEHSESNEFLREPPNFVKNTNSDEKPLRPKLEPVVTLQMLQAKKQGSETLKLNLPSGQKIDPTPPPSPAQGIGAEGKQPVYVVYPVKSTPMKMDSAQSGSNIDSVVVGLRGEQAPLPPLRISPGTEYQNTPFSIASHFEQEPILMAKEKKQQQKINFPYNLERPDPHAAMVDNDNDFRRNPSEQELNEKKQDTIYNIGEEPISKEHSEDSPISTKLQRATDSTPIAIAYTPTESNLKYKYKIQNSPYYSPYGETQTEVSYLKIDDFDEFGNPAHRYEQSFQAPFQASISLDPVKVTNPYEGWAVVTSPPQALIQEPIKVDRSDSNHHDEPIQQSTSKPVAADSKGSFQPEFEGGFRPIYAEDVKLSELVNPDPQSRNAYVASHDEEPVASVENSESVVHKTNKIEQPEKPDHADKPILDSLEAFFDDLTKDYEDNTEFTTGLGEEDDLEESTSKYINEVEGRSNDGVEAVETTVKPESNASSEKSEKQKISSK
ncbi:uncharacterized protein LOC129740342 [Uranotaenia lowii]|uniref:uncharacterized protein LOC129740342 n=1 Tax=Uranotaenia lowii TaxID=190385 RepID=UPI00247904DD|nr:uncharacterized protein LOC129740342 [Uranotaenia lowii]